MKKVILSVLVVGSLLATSCKKLKEGAKSVKETTETVADKATEVATDAIAETKGAVEATTEKTTDAVKNLVGNIAIPSFGNEEVDSYVKKYAEYAQEYIAAKGNVLKGDLAKKGQELATKAQGITSKLNADDAKKLNDFLSGLQAKMVESTKK